VAWDVEYLQPRQAVWCCLPWAAQQRTLSNAVIDGSTYENEAGKKLQLAYNITVFMLRQDCQSHFRHTRFRQIAVAPRDEEIFSKTYVLGFADKK
jgi:hypothetical protein